jgi:hypothetical protein
MNSADEPLPEVVPHQIEIALKSATNKPMIITVLRLLAAIAEYILLFSWV